MKAKVLVATLMVLVIATSPVFAIPSSWLNWGSNIANSYNKTPTTNTSINRTTVSYVSRGSAFGASNIGGSIGDVKNPFGPLISLFQSWLTSFLFGALFAIRFAKDVLNAYVNRDEHPEAMKQAVIRFAVTLVFVTVIFHMIASGLGNVVERMFL